MQYKKLWIAFGLIMLISFSVLGGVGYKAINNGPPIPAKVVTTDGRLLFTGETIRAGALSDPAKQHQMATFFWWTAWAASTNRPGQDVTYTQNWPHEELVGNRPTGGTVVWSVISFVLLLAGIGGMVWYFGSQQHRSSPDPMPRRDPLLGLQPTPSQKATVKYFFVVAALWVVQVALGAIVAHYGVEGGGFYGIPLGKWLP